MPFDGIVTKCVVDDLKKKLLDGKVEKIFLPTPDELIFHIYKYGQTLKLFISINPQYARIHLTSINRANPPAPPVFCMLLRKYLEGSKISNVLQIDMDRVIHLEFDGRDEYGNSAKRLLIIELMGKHSNAILVNAANNMIFDGMRRITDQVSRHREILPNSTYALPPGEKSNPLEISEIRFLELLQLSSIGNPTVEQFLYKQFNGISPLLAREIALRSSIESNFKIADLSSNAKISLWQNFADFFSNVANERYFPIMIEQNDQKIDFYATDLLQFDSINKSFYDDIHCLLESFYNGKVDYARLLQEKGNLNRIVNTEIERGIKKIKILQETLEKAEDADRYRIYGELIMASIGQIQKGDEFLITPNYYDENLTEIKIILDPSYSASDNAKKYFKKYQKLKKSVGVTNEQLEKTKEELNYLQQVHLSIEHADELLQLEEIKEELIETGLIKVHKKEKRPKREISSPHRFLSSDGIEIFVGKNNKQNDLLTCKMAASSDIWLHVKDIPGSHVIIRLLGSNYLPDATLNEASQLAAYFSKAKGSSKVPVDYTFIKHVKKPNGAKLGMVIYENQNTIMAIPQNPYEKNNSLK